MKIKLLIPIFLTVFSLISRGQEPKAEKTDWVSLTGYVKTDFYYDSRQTVAAREGHFLLYPSPVLNDREGNDVNAKSAMNIMAIQSRLSLKLTGPDAWNAKTSGLIEGDFFGQLNENISLFRLRQAYFQMKWQKTTLLFGQHWHPLFVTSCYPTTVSFNAGVPIQPLSRTPQIRLNYTMGKIEVFGAVLSQRDYKSMGPTGSDSKYLRNSGMPELQSQISFNSNATGEGSQLVTGIGFGYKRLVPQIRTDSNYVTNATVRGLSSIAFLKYTQQSLTFKLYGLYHENGSEFLSLSGYAVKDTTDKTKLLVDYSPLRTASVWSEIHTNGKKIQLGLFAGYTKNMGSKEQVSGSVYIPAKIKDLYRISPRVTFLSGRTTLALETEYTVANYGTTDDYARIVNTTEAANLRFLFSAIYAFK